MRFILLAFHLLSPAFPTQDLFANLKKGGHSTRILRERGIMKKAPLHPEEERRLAALEQLDLLDTPSEREFDEATFLASTICNTPIALVSLVDRDRQWFKSNLGLEARQTPRDFAFCAHAILEGKLFIVEDANLDERFTDNPLVLGEPHVVFYAGAPLKDPISNLPIGTLCVIGHKPQKISEVQKRALLMLANQIETIVSLRIKNREIVAQNQKLMDYKIAIDNLSEGVVFQDRSGSIIEFNPSACILLNLSPDQLLGKTSFDPDWKAIREDGTEFAGSEHPSMVTLTTGRCLRDIPMGIRSDQKNVCWLSINATPIFRVGEEKPHRVVTTFTETTERRRQADILLRKSNLAVLGEMAAGIAHEINTPLTTIGISVEQCRRLMLAEVMDGKKLSEKIERIDATSKRIATIVKGMRSITRNTSNDSHQPMSVLAAMEDALSLSSEKFASAGIEIDRSELVDGIVCAIQGQVTQVFLNILNNSVDAVEQLSQKWVKIKSENNPSDFSLRITDSGTGISDKVIGRIMHPFFTTKEVGRGTGLGLSISRSILEQFGGLLQYELFEGHTSFIVKLPKKKYAQ